MNDDPHDFQISCPCYHTGKTVRIGERCVAIFDFNVRDISGGPPHRPRHVVVSKDSILLMSISDEWITIRGTGKLYSVHRWREVQAFTSGPRDPHQN